MASDPRYIKASEKLQDLVDLAEAISREQQAKDSALLALAGTKRGREQEHGNGGAPDSGKRGKKQRRSGRDRPSKGNDGSARGRQQGQLAACERCKKPHGPKGSPEKNCWASVDADGNKISSPPTATMPDYVKKKSQREDGTAKKDGTAKSGKAIRALKLDGNKKGARRLSAEQSSSDSESGGGGDRE